MDSLRKTALVAGVLYLITFVSIPTLALYGPVRNDPDYILGAGTDTAVIFGGILEIIVALACIGTAVALYPVVKRQNEGGRAGLRRRADPGSRRHLRRRRQPARRIVTLRQAGAGADALVTGQALARPVQLDVPARAEPHAGRERPAAGLPDVPVRAWCRGSFPWSGLIGAPLLLAADVAARCSASGDRCPRCPDSAHSRSRSGSSRWASTWSSRASSRPPITADMATVGEVSR